MEFAGGNVALTRFASPRQESSSGGTAACAPSSSLCPVPTAHSNPASMESLCSDSPTRPLLQLRIPEDADHLANSVDKDETGKLFRVKISPVTHCVSSVSDYGTMPIPRCAKLLVRAEYGASLSPDTVHSPTITNRSLSSRTSLVMWMDRTRS